MNSAVWILRFLLFSCIVPCASKLKSFIGTFWLLGGTLVVSRREIHYVLWVSCDLLVPGAQRLLALSVMSSFLCSQERFAYWVEHWLSLDVYFTVYFGFRVIFVHLVPCVSLVVLNVLLFRALRDAQLKRDKLLKENRKSECKRLRDSNCTTLMLIVVVTVFLCTEIPLAVVTVRSYDFTISWFILLSQNIPV